MHISRSVGDLRKMVGELKRSEKKVALVPTMGALHEGHLSLIRLARKHADAVVVSAFVNPTQFGPGEDYDRYPRSESHDTYACEAEGVDIYFMPGVDEMYGKESRIGFTIDKMDEHLCGASRPHHFPGVMQVVNKLFNMVQPDAAVFGQKDIQQYKILERMRDEFAHPVEMIQAPIVRDTDGLALSSRNAYLTKEQRNKAPMLYQALHYVAMRIQKGDTHLINLLEDRKRTLTENGFQIDYFQCVETDELQPVTEPKAGQNYIVAGAVYLGATRLIDNIIVEASDRVK